MVRHEIHRNHAPRRRFLGATLAFLSLLGVAGSASAQNWPDKPIKLLVPFAAGGNIDVTGRLVAARLSEALGQQMVVENRVGGGGIIAMEAVQRAAPDGYTLLWASTNVMAIVPATNKVKYDPIKDYAPISQLGSSPQVLLVNSKVPAKTVAEFVAYAKAQPQPLAYGGGGGPGSASNLIMALFLNRADLKMTSVSYRGTAPALTDVIGGQIPDHLRADFGSRRAGHQSEHPHSGGVERQTLGALAGCAVDRGDLSGLQRGVLDRNAGAGRERPSRSSTRSQAKWRAPAKTRSSSSCFRTTASIRPSKARRNLPP